MVEQLAGQVKILALARQHAIVTGARFMQIDLDHRKNLSRTLGISKWVVYLAPPPSLGSDDPRMRHFLAAAGAVERCIYVSTTGVYGAANGAWVKETTPLKPSESRGMRRVDAENRLKCSRIPKVSVLRAPGIYALQRLPIGRIEQGLPAFIATDDVPTNHIHADDLARLCWLGLFRAGNRRAYNAADGQPMMHGDYLSAVADAFGFQAPPRLPKAQVKAQLSPIAWSMLAGARRVDSQRILKEWRVRLKYPDVSSFLIQTVQRTAKH
jgi:nucleoside-diphosphate-sugar epimerase